MDMEDPLVFNDMINAGTPSSVYISFERSRLGKVGALDLINGHPQLKTGLRLRLLSRVKICWSPFQRGRELSWMVHCAGMRRHYKTFHHCSSPVGELEGAWEELTFFCTPQEAWGFRKVNGVFRLCKGGEPSCSPQLEGVEVDAGF